MNKTAMNEDESKTVWINDTNEVASFKLVTHKKYGNQNTGTVFKQIVIKPGEKVELESHYDEAIRSTYNGRIVGGLCPWLKKLDESSVNMEECLDYKFVEEQLKLQDLAKKIREEESLRAASERMKEDKSPGRPKKTAT